MNQDQVRQYAQNFLRAYHDPDIDKWMWFDFWSDKLGMTTEQKDIVWAQVTALTRRLAGEKAIRTRALRRNSQMRLRHNRKQEPMRP